MEFSSVFKIHNYPSYLRYVLKRIKLEIIGARDRRILISRFPELQNYKKSYSKYYQRYITHYKEYINNVSTEEMAISLELTIFIRVLCDIVKPGKILDIGSGFSSFVFRDFQKSSDIKPEIWSVDNSKKWLMETKKYLSKHNLSGNNLLLWNVFVKNDSDRYDLILHDLGRMDARKTVMQNVLKFVKEGGIVILDDVHKTDYYNHVKDVLRDQNLDFISLYDFTRDRYGRYSFLVFND